jgi:hypothetical protein
MPTDYGTTMRTFPIPAPLVAEHEALHQRLAHATREPGDVGAAARTVARLLHPHFVKEEAFALPPLALLPELAAGQPTPGIEDVLPMTSRLAAELPGMLAEHRAIVAALETLRQAARAAARPQYEAFADALVLHARTEEDVLYPASLLVGAHVATLRREMREKIA